MNCVSVVVLFGLGFVMPMIARYEAKKHGRQLMD